MTPQVAAHVDVKTCHNPLEDRSKNREKGNTKRTVLQMRTCMNCVAKMRTCMNSVASENSYELRQPKSNAEGTTKYLLIST